MIRLLLAVLLASLVAVPAAAKDWPEFRQIKAGESVSPRADRAYLLMRVRKSALGWVSPVWLRVPRADEVAAYEAAKQTKLKAKLNNFYGIDTGKSFAEETGQRTILVEVEPGNYVLAGNGMRNMMITCFCQGTVEFAAKAGVVTDLGTILIEPGDRPSSDPELATVTGLGAMARMDYLMFSGAVRPYRAGDARPAAIAAMPAVVAEYRATAPFVVPSATLANFLAPLPGVLEYRRGEVVDVKTGQIVPPR